MPAFVTHALFGEEVLEQITDPQIARLLAENQEAFYWGLQGPDLLFYRRALAPYGQRMHRERTAELFGAAARHLVLLKGATEYRTVLAYFYGFLCHYCLDVHLHPYVYYHQYRREEKAKGRVRGCHQRIESDIDAQYYQLKKQRPVAEYTIPAGYGENMVLCNAVARLHSFLLYKVYNEEVEDKAILKAFPSMARLLRLCLRPGPFYGLALVGECLFGKRFVLTAHVRRAARRGDALNRGHHRWSSPARPREVSTASVEELMHKARRSALEQIAFFADAIEKNRVQLEERPFLPFDNGSIPRQADQSKKIGSRKDGDRV